MSTPETPTTEGCPLTVEKTASGDHYDVFVHYGGAKLRINTLPAGGVDADIAEAQAAQTTAQTTAPPSAL